MNPKTINVPRQSLYLLVTWLVLLAFGTIMVGSASVAMAGDYTIKQLVNLCISVFLAVIVLTIPSSTWAKFLLAKLDCFTVCSLACAGAGYWI